MLTPWLPWHATQVLTSISVVAIFVSAAALLASALVQIMVALMNVAKRKVFLAIWRVPSDLVSCDASLRGRRKTIT